MPALRQSGIPAFGAKTFDAEPAMIKRHRTETKPKAEINIAPLTDVMLVLLVIFIVITPFLLQSETKISQLKVNLPVAAKFDKAQPDLIKITVKVDGTLILNGARIAQDQLRASLEQLLQANPARSVAVYGDRACRYESVVAVVDVAKQAGVRHVALAVRTKEKK